MACGLQHAHHGQDYSRNPEPNLENVQDEESLQARIPMQGGDILGEELVGDDHK